jgi:hypothetical protein
MPVAVPINNRVDVAGITKKWEKWLKGVKTEEKRTNLAILLENQNNYNKGSLLREATLSGDAGAFQKVILPVIRRVFPRLVAPELVGIQPMTGPTGLAIFLKYFYEASGQEILKPQGAVDGRRIYMRSFESGPYLDSIVGGAAPHGAITNNGTATVTATFGANALLLPGNGSTGTGQTWDTWSGAASFTAKLQINVASSATDAVGVLTLTNSAPYGASLPSWTGEFTQISGPTVVFDGVGATPGAGDHFACSAPATYTQAALVFVITCFAGDVASIVTYDKPGAPDAPAAAIFNDGVFLKAGCPVLVANGLEQASPASLSVKFETHPIVAEDYKLQATWSLEAAQDVNALQGESLEEVLSNLLTQELMNEIDFIVLKDLLNMAGIAATWNKFPGTTPTSGANTSMPAYRGSLKEWWETLPMLMNDVANSIHTRILRGPANFAVCSPDVSTIVESLPDFKSASLNDLDTEVGIVPVGTLTSKYKLYKDARLAKGTLLMGYKGQDSRNTGYIYSPYVPATLSPIIWDPQTYNNKRMIMTRFGRTTLLDGQFFYARIRVSEGSNVTTDWMSA